MLYKIYSMQKTSYKNIQKWFLSSYNELLRKYKEAGKYERKKGIASTSNSNNRGERNGNR